MRCRRRDGGSTAESQASPAARAPPPPPPPPPQEADYIEFFAEIDLLCALSACPGGDLSCWEWSDEAAMRATCRPLAVEVYEIPERIRTRVLEGWEPPHPSNYGGNHGISIPRGEGIAA